MSSLLQLHGTNTDSLDVLCSIKYAANMMWIV